MEITTSPPLTEDDLLSSLPYLGVRYTEPSAPPSKKEVQQLIYCAEAYMKAVDLVRRNRSLPPDHLTPFKKAINYFSHCYRDDAVEEVLEEARATLAREATSVVDKVMSAPIQAETPLEALRKRIEVYDTFYDPLVDTLKSTKTFPYTPQTVIDFIHPVFLQHAIQTLPTDGCLGHEVQRIASIIHPYIHNPFILGFPPISDWSKERLIKEISYHTSPEIREAIDKGEKYRIQSDYVASLSLDDEAWNIGVDLLLKIQNVFITALEAIPETLSSQKKNIAESFVGSLSTTPLEAEIHELNTQLEAITARAATPLEEDAKNLLNLTQKIILLTNKKTTLEKLAN